MARHGISCLSFGVNLTTSGTTCRETQRVSPRQLTSTPAQALQALHGSQNGNTTRSSPNAMIGNNTNGNNNGNFSLDHPTTASPNMVAAASAALSAAAALDPLLQVITLIHSK